MMQSGSAETLALKALAWLAQDGDRLLRFLTETGLDLEILRERAADPELLAGVMDFLLADDALLAGFCAELRIESAEVHAARRQLPGGMSGA